MPLTKIIFYQDEDGTVPVLEWLRNLPPKVQDKCVVKIERRDWQLLAMKGG